MDDVRIQTHNRGARAPMAPLYALKRILRGICPPLASFPNADVCFVEHAKRKGCDDLFVYEYAPTGRRLCLDRLGRPHQFAPLFPLAPCTLCAVEEMLMGDDYVPIDERGA